MNWFKKAQQGLLFYPWVNRPEDVSQNLPQMKENTNVCQLCGKEIQKD